jgi:hypothetical protein
VSKRPSAPYRSGPSRDWIKVKNPDSPAMLRALAGVGAGRAAIRRSPMRQAGYAHSRYPRWETVVCGEDGVAIFDALPVHLEILSASRNQTFTCCHRLPAYLNSSSSGFSRPK